MSSLFITGTDSDVGKTIVTRTVLQLLARQGFSVVGYKPIACGRDDSLPPEPSQSDYAGEDNSDVLIIQDSCSTPVSYQDINSYTFTHPATPVFAALDTVHNIQEDKLNKDLVRLQQQYPNVVVEGTYGWLTPINKELSFAQWVYKNQMPVVLVVGIKEGCVNHALLTAQAIKQQNVPLIGWVVNRINPGLQYYAELIELLCKKIEAPLLGEIPYIGRPYSKDLTPYIQNPAPLLDYFSK